MTAPGQIRLKRLFASSTGGSWGAPPEEEGTVLPCVRGTDLDFQRLRVNLGSAPMRSYLATDIHYRAATAGDIIIEKSGGGENQPVGRVGLMCEQTLVMPTNFAGRLRPAPDQDARYLTYLLASLYFAGRTRAAIKQTTGIQNLELGALLATAVPRLTQNEQRAIADYLDAETARIDALITKKRRMTELLVEKVDAQIFSAVCGTVPSPASSRQGTQIPWLDTIPSHWGSPWLGANHSTQLGKMLSASAASGPEQHRYVKNTNVQWDRLDLTDLPTMTFDVNDRARCSLEKGDLLVCEGGEVGRAAVWPGAPTDVYFQKAIHRVRPIGEAEPRFTMYAFWAAAKMNVFSVEGNQATIVHLTGEKLREHRFPWPPLEEQREIVRQLDSAREKVERTVTRLDQQINLLAERRQALITAAVTGELEIQGVAA